MIFEINAIKAKQFYVESKSEKDALELPEVECETRFRNGDFDWEHIETTATKISRDQAKWIKEHRSDLILATPQT